MSALCPIRVAACAYTSFALSVLPWPYLLAADGALEGRFLFLFSGAVRIPRNIYRDVVDFTGERKRRRSRAGVPP